MTTHFNDVRDEPMRLGVNTLWRESGSGDAGTVLMLHSLGLDRCAFDGMRRALPSHWRVVSFDARGHGAASAATAFDFDDCVADALAAVELCAARYPGVPVHLIGHSMGGALAASVAARMHDAKRIASLALIATPPVGMPAFAERGDSAHSEGMRRAIDNTLERWFGKLQDQEIAPALAYARASLSTMQERGYVSAWHSLAQFGGYGALAATLPPTLALAGSDDLSTPPAVMAAIGQAFSTAGVADMVQTATIEGAGHMLVLTHAAMLARKLDEHWRIAMRFEA